MISTDKRKLIEAIDERERIFADSSDGIWGFAETRFALPKSADALISILEREGFTVRRGVAEMDDAFVATWGSGAPVIGFLAEYDALSNLNQVANLPEKRAAAADEPGHGCGHNILGAGAVAAAIGLRHALASEDSATVKLFGCPAEEGGSGKAFMARAGIFDGADAMFTWHPWAETKIWGFSSLANYQVSFHFKGISSHAAASPEQGRSALDAAELMSMGVNYLREHIIQEARIHYAYTNAGGVSPNVVQPNASVLYFVRAPKSSQVGPIFDRVVDIANGAALMTGTKVEIEWDSACSEYIINDALGRAMHANMSELGDLVYTDEERAYAKKFTDTLPESSRKGVEAEILKRFEGVSQPEAERMSAEPVQGELFPYSMTEVAMAGSTDVGDASWISPTAQAMITCYPTGTTSHSWQWVATGKSEIAHKGLIYAAKAMGMTALDAVQNPELLRQAKDEHARRLGGEPYRCPIPDEVKPR